MRFHCPESSIKQHACCLLFLSVVACFCWTEPWDSPVYTIHSLCHFTHVVWMTFWWYFWYDCVCTVSLYIGFFFCTILRLEYVWQLYSTVVEEAWGSSFTVLLQCNCTHFLPGAVKGVWSNLLFLLQVQTKNPLRQPRDVRAFPLWLEQSGYVGTENHITKVVNAKI